MAGTGPTLDELLATLQAGADLKKFRKKLFFSAYPKQKLFFDAGAKHAERLLSAGNQQGKTEAGAFEMACHLTGEYPADWNGRRFDHPVRVWACCETGLLTRDGVQKKLCGPPGVTDEFGTGYIPKDAFKDQPTLSRGVTDAYDQIQVEHKTNGVVDGVSVLMFKSYEQGRAKFQSETLDIVWCDEEPPIGIYTEILARVTAGDNGKGGMVYITFTPLLGMSEVVMRFLNEEDPARWHITMTIDDALHIAPERRAAIIAQYPAHEREARTKGVPMMGSGRIFPYSEEALTEVPMSYVPLYWTKIWGIDFGIGHPFAAVLIAWDKDNDVIHILHTIRISDQMPLQHSMAMKPVGAAVPIAWPQDGTAREKGSGEPLAKQYKKLGLAMLADHATHPDGSVSTEAGILEMQQRMETGRLKVAAHLSDWFEEFRMYHRKDGQIVKLKDDILSATRIAIMMRRFSKPVQLGGQLVHRKRTDGLADGVDFDVFA